MLIRTPCKAALLGTALALAMLADAPGASAASAVIAPPSEVAVSDRTAGVKTAAAVLLAQGGVKAKGQAAADAVAADVASLLLDPECGRPAVIEAKGRFFDNIHGYVGRATEVAASGRKAARTLAPVAGDTRKAVALVRAFAARYPGTAQSATALIDALQGLRRDAGDVVKGRLPTAANATWVLLTKFGAPFVAKCVGCAKGIVGAVKSIAKAAGWGAATGGATFICPETAGASCVAAGATTFATAVNITKAAANSIGALVGCGLMVRQWMTKKDEFLAALHTFTSSMRELGAGIGKTARQLRATRQALANLRRAAGRRGAEQLKQIDGQIGRIAANVGKAQGIVRQEVRPAVVALSGDVAADVQKGVATLSRCYAKTKKVAAHRLPAR